MISVLLEFSFICFLDKIFCLFLVYCIFGFGILVILYVILMVVFLKVLIFEFILVVIFWWLFEVIGFVDGEIIGLEGFEEKRSVWVIKLFDYEVNLIKLFIWIYNRIIMSLYFFCLVSEIWWCSVLWGKNGMGVIW